MRRCVLFLTTLIVINTIFLPTVSAESNTLPSIESEAAIIMEAESGQILYKKNAASQMYPASLTKIITAIYAIENADLNDMVTISSNASAKNIEGTTVFLEKGEKVRLEKLIKGLLINSGNDAGVAIAEYVSGSEEQFSEDINDYLENVIGVEHTHLKNPHGLFDPEHVTTAEDLAKVTKYAMKNETFAEIFGTKEMEWDGKAWDTTLITHHKLLKGEIPYENITGGKNGFVHESGYTLTTTAENEDLSLIVITLKSNDSNGAYEDTINLLNYGFDHYKTSYIAEDTSFTLEGDKYTTPEKLAYTQPLNNEIDKQVTTNGELVIVNEDEEVIHSFKLKKMDSKEDKLPNVSDNENIESQDGVQLNYTSLGQLFVVSSLILMVIGYFYRKIK
ncbi:D-alanyl-D-alanine carboxypeptidase [Gracilibacillus salitolerans]|uniref:D-alanyl-D-alanine carboxypeptidase n=1 Tax=Gracilibacillus salitolerans TaxID=2663022 RepID=A0A5Q2TQC9_9BACI|nr:D-alanyl-D-alanine carboxypeptidase family protein [Gracilibacillus salitolerans]QGH36292.1 D-alanyl-D-alanine carboxypeptidase [Gracilibacillus salitolerans]